MKEIIGLLFISKDSSLIGLKGHNKKIIKELPSSLKKKLLLLNLQKIQLVNLITRFVKLWYINTNWNCKKTLRIKSINNSIRNSVSKYHIWSDE